MIHNRLYLQFFLFFIVNLLIIQNVFAHCDTLDGPVIKAGQQALETKDVNLVLIWIKKNDEPEIKAAFQQALAVRKLSPEAAKLADKYFFETLVRVHRAGEGAPYTGLKSAEHVDLAIPAADKALEANSIEPVISFLSDKMKRGITDHFDQVMHLKNFPKNDVAAGRKFVEAYVSYIHYIEGIYTAVINSAKGHYPDQEEKHSI